jgi:hypothetical protein
MCSYSLCSGLRSIIAAIAGLLLLVKPIETQSVATLEAQVIDQSGAAISRAEIAQGGH